jgi:hypothetical protein
MSHDPIAHDEMGAEHPASMPPSIPKQFQFHGPTPHTVPDIPAVQSQTLGIVFVGTQFAHPH